MLGKLYKHEFKALGRFLVPASLVLIGLAVFCRLLLLVDVDFFLVDMMKWMATSLNFLGFIAIYVVALALVISRFYKNLLTKEGYLTFTLPFTATQHIFCKLICGMAAFLFSTVVVLLALNILGLGTDFAAEFYHSAGLFLLYLVSQGVHFPIWMILFVLVLVLSCSASLLLYYASMSLGQRFQKNRVAGAVLWYVIFYIITQFMFGSFTTVIGLVGYGMDLSFLNQLSPVGATYLVFAVLLVVLMIQNVVYYLITQHTLTNNLNLE